MSAGQVRVRMEGSVWTGWGDTPATVGEGSQVGGLMSHLAIKVTLGIGVG